MTMNPARLPSRQTPGSTTVPAPAVPTPAGPAPTPAPATPVQSTASEAFTGLDPLTRSLIEAAPLVPAQPPAPIPTPPSPPTQGVPAVARRTLKQPAVLVALGGSLAAGLLVLSGAATRRRTGHPAAGSGRAAAPVSSPAPILPVNLPPPAPSWLVGGGRA